MTRLQGILAAGSLTGIVLVSSLALGAGKLLAPPTPTPTPVIESSGGMSPSREKQYTDQINAANATILQLEAQINTMSAGTGGSAPGSSGAPAVAPTVEPKEQEPAEHQAGQQETEQEAGGGG